MRSLINYMARSKFKERILIGLREQRETFIRGEDVVICFSEMSEGYAGDVIVHIPSTSPSAFCAHWYHEDLARFPVRIRAAATVLHETGEAGAFRIRHKSGLLTISTLD